MAEKFADLRQRRSLLEHLTGECVPKLVGAFARRIDSGPLQSVSHNRTDPTLTSEPSGGRFRTEENASAVGSRPSMPQIIGDCRADILWQW
jgi:hypothetical protein